MSKWKVYKLLKEYNGNPPHYLDFVSHCRKNDIGEPELYILQLLDSGFVITNNGRLEIP